MLRLALIDVEIRDIISALNRKPFVLQTLFSCAGYGKAGTDVRHPHEIPPSDPLGHVPRSSGYVVIAYRRDHPQWKPFHQAMSSLVDRVRSMDVSRRELQAPVFSYTFKGTARPALMAKKWDSSSDAPQRLRTDQDKVGGLRSVRVEPWARAQAARARRAEPPYGLLSPPRGWRVETRQEWLTRLWLEDLLTRRDPPPLVLVGQRANVLQSTDETEAEA